MVHISTATSRPSAARGSATVVRLRPLALLVAVAVLTLGACGGAVPAPSAAQAASTPSAAGSPAIPPSAAPSATDTVRLVALDDALDPGAAAQHELLLDQQARTDGGMAALLGDHGEAVFEEFDAQASAFSQDSLEQIAHLIDTGDMPDSAIGAALTDLVAMVGSALPPTQHERLDAIDLSLFALTGFTTSALLGVATGAITLADRTNDGTLPRSDHIERTSNGLRQVVDLNMTWVIHSGGGKLSFEIQMSATDNVSDATSGSFVALYTSTSNGKFEIDACPQEGGTARGTYSFQTKHELNDVSGAANARSGARRAVDAPFTLYDGDDAHLQRIETTLDMAADAHGPGGSASGSADAFDWTASQTLPLVMTRGGATTSSGGSGLSAQGTGGEGAAGSMFNSSTMAQLLLAQIGKETETFWRSGKCIELKPDRDTGKVEASEAFDVSVIATGKFSADEIDAPISATFTGVKSVEPAGEAVPYPPKFHFTAGSKDGDKGTIELQQVSNRGIGKKTIEFTVGSPHIGGTIQFDTVETFLRATSTFHITVKAVLLVDETSRRLAAEPDGGSTFSYDFKTTGGNVSVANCEANCPRDPPCSSHGDGRLEDPARFEKGTTGAIAVRGALGDDRLVVTVAIPIKCGTYKTFYVPLICGEAEGFKAELDGDATYRIASTCNFDLSRTGIVNRGQGHVEGTLAPLDGPSRTP